MASQGKVAWNSKLSGFSCVQMCRCLKIHFISVYWMHFDARIHISHIGRDSISRLMKLFCSIIKMDFATTGFDVVSQFPTLQWKLMLKVGCQKLWVCGNKPPATSYLLYHRNFSHETGPLFTSPFSNMYKWHILGLQQSIK